MMHNYVKINLNTLKILYIFLHRYYFNNWLGNFIWFGQVNQKFCLAPRIISQLHDAQYLRGT